jgi:ADP-ribose pyrophosphatase
MPESDCVEVLAEGRHLRLLKRGRWEYVQRTKPSGIACIIAVTNDDRLLLVEQFRPPLERRVIELPAGLAGDTEGQEHESLKTAARRELLEETGYDSVSLEQLCETTSSAGLTDETATFFIARDLIKITGGGGDGTEDIAVHEVPLKDVGNWLASATRRGCLIDARVFAGLYLLEKPPLKL